MAGDTPSRVGFEKYREYLRLLARLHLDHSLRGRVDPSDVVQQTIVEAFEGRADFRGDATAVEAAWLRRILARNIANLRRDHHRGKRDVELERSLEADMERSTVRMAFALADDAPSPSQGVVRDEESLRLADAIGRLPREEMEIVLLRHFEGMALDAIAERVRATKYHVAQSLRRAMDRLRRELAENDA